MKNADLHCSYSAPVRVSVFSVVVARAVTIFTELIWLRDTGVLVAVLFVAALGVKIVTDFALRGETVVFTALREVVARAVLLDVEIVVFFPREALFSVRDTAPALNVQTTEAIIKARIFFISESMLANL